MPLSCKLRVLIPGGTGRLGLLLARHLHEQGHIVSAITRFPNPREWEAIHWDAQNLGDWVHAFEDADVVINLAGSSMRGRFTAANRRLILESRLRTTELVGRAIDSCSRPPKIWFNASTLDIYPDTKDIEADDCASEYDGPYTFSGEVARKWEAKALSFSTPETRKVLLRMAPIMSPCEGFSFDPLLRLVRLGFGGECGNGEQYVAWVHDEDIIRAIEFLIADEKLDGAVNITAPVPIPNHQFMQELRDAWSSNHFGVAIPEAVLKVFCFAVRMDPERWLKSRRVVPNRLRDAGFVFLFPEWRTASENLVRRWHGLNSSKATASP